MGTVRIFSIWRLLFIFFIKWQRWCKVLCLVNCNHKKKFFSIFLMERPYYTLKTNSFSCLNLDEIEFIFICPIIVLLIFFNLKLLTSDRGFKYCLLFRLVSLFSELFSELALSITLFWSSKCLSFQATSFQNSLEIKPFI